MSIRIVKVPWKECIEDFDGALGTWKVNRIPFQSENEVEQVSRTPTSTTNCGDVDSDTTCSSETTWGTQKRGRRVRDETYYASKGMTKTECEKRVLKNFKRRNSSGTTHGKVGRLRKSEGTTKQIATRQHKREQHELKKVLQPTMDAFRDKVSEAGFPSVESFLEAAAKSESVWQR